MNIWEIVFIGIIGIVLIVLILLSIFLMCDIQREKKANKYWTRTSMQKVNISDKDAKDVFAIVQDLVRQDKVRVILTWDEGKVEVVGERRRE